MHNVKIQVSKTLRTYQARRRDLNPMHLMQPTSKQLFFETRHVRTYLQLLRLQAYRLKVKMYEKVYSTLTSIRDVHSITSIVYIRRSFLV